jgi:hypothetical protein
VLKLAAGSATPTVLPFTGLNDPHDVAVDTAGANVKAVQKMLGHASAAMTLDIYADLFSDDLDAVATALDRAREKCAQNVLTGRRPVVQAPAERSLTLATVTDLNRTDLHIQKSQSSSSVTTALPIT